MVIISLSLIVIANKFIDGENFYFRPRGEMSSFQCDREIGRDDSIRARLMKRIESVDYMD